MGELRGEKVVLRPYAEGGGLAEDELRSQYLWDQDKEIRRLMGTPERELTFVEFKHFWEGERRRPSPNRVVFAIYTLKERFIGRISCSGIDRQRGQGELGIVIGEKDLWGQGYGRDAIRVFLDYLFRKEGLQRVTLFTFPYNLRAQRCFEACGFRSLGRKWRLTLGMERLEGIEMAITADDFLDLQRKQPEQRKESGGGCDGP